MVQEITRPRNSQFRGRCEAKPDRLSITRGAQASAPRLNVHAAIPEMRLGGGDFDVHRSRGVEIGVVIIRSRVRDIHRLAVHAKDERGRLHFGWDWSRLNTRGSVSQGRERNKENQKQSDVEQEYKPRRRTYDIFQCSTAAMWPSAFHITRWHGVRCSEGDGFTMRREMNAVSKRPAVVLLSGGLDSATVAAIALTRGFRGPRALVLLWPAAQLGTRSGPPRGALARHRQSSRRQHRSARVRRIGAHRRYRRAQGPQRRRHEPRHPDHLRPGAQHDFPLLRIGLGRSARRRATSSSA